jgi:hypothetical protein
MVLARLTHRGAFYFATQREADGAATGR